MSVRHAQIICCIILAAPLFAASATTDEEKVQWLKKNAVPIEIAPEREDFSDLMPLAQAIGSKRIVMLGEPTHGDGAAFHAKSRLVRFLHQVMGFDVLAWESGLFDCALVDANIRSDKPFPEASRGIFGIWSNSKEVLPTFEYVRATQKTTRPMTMAGIDIEFSAPDNPQRFSQAVIDFFNRIQPLSAGDAQAFVAFVTQVTPWSYAPTGDERKKSADLVARMLGTLSLPAANAKASRHELIFMQRLLRNLLALEESRYLHFTEKPENSNRRDQGMGENLVWLAGEFFPDRKIIVWAASVHNARQLPSAIKTDYYKDVFSMGEDVHQRLADELYSIAFIAHAGQWGRATASRETFDLQPAPGGSLEDLCHRTGMANLFIDLQGTAAGHWLRSPVLAAPMGYGPMPGEWPRIFDGFIFIDRMYPSTAIKPPGTKP